MKYGRVYNFFQARFFGGDNFECSTRFFLTLS